MYAVAWKETLSNGSQPIRMKQFRTEDARADFIDTLRDNGVSFQITSMNIAGDPELQDFRKGMRVKIHISIHRSLCGQEGTVLRAVRRSGMVLVMLDSGTEYYAWPWNLKQLSRTMSIASVPGSSFKCDAPFPGRNIAHQLTGSGFFMNAFSASAVPHASHT